MISGSTIIVCTCEHKEQDELHGKYKRVGNYIGSSTKDSPKARCTVCGKETNCKPIKSV
jgi:hypothetical protein